MSLTVFGMNHHQRVVSYGRDAAELIEEALAARAQNGTTYAKHYRSATAQMLTAMATPSRERFLKAHRTAILAIGAAYTQRHGLEWEMGQTLARTIRDAARESGFDLSEEEGA